MEQTRAVLVDDLIGPPLRTVGDWSCWLMATRTAKSDREALAFGAYEGPGVHGQILARNHFLSAVRTHAPDVLAELAELASEPGTIDEALTTWASRWGINEGWILQAAQITLRAWKTRALEPSRVAQPPYDPRQDEAREWAYWTVAIDVPFEGHELATDFVCPTWDPLNADEASFREHAHAAWTTYLDTYCCRVRAIAEGHGLVPSPRRKEGKHFTWLVDYQVLGHNYSQVAKRHRFDRQTIFDEVARVAAKVGLTLRTQPPGRPRRTPR